MDPIYLGGPKPPSDAEPMDQDFVTDDDEEDQLLSDLEDPTPAPPAEPPKPALPSGQELEPDPADDDLPPLPGQKQRKGGAGARRPLTRVPGFSLLPEDRVDYILEENGAAGAMGREATFLLSMATEEFIRKLAQAGHMSAVSQERDVIEYGDLAQATSMKCFAMLEDVVPCPKPLSQALDMRARFIKRQIAEDPALTAAPEPAPLPDPHAPLVAYPSGQSTPWDSVPASKGSTPVPPPTTAAAKRTKSAPAAPVAPPAAPAAPAPAPAPAPAIATSNGKRKVSDAQAQQPLAKERRASMRNRDKHGRFGNNPVDPAVWDNKFAPAPAAAPPQDPWAKAPPASLPGPPPAAAQQTAQAGAGDMPFGTTGRTIYSQR